MYWKIDMKDIFKDKTILVTGGVGSIGSELVRQLLQHDPAAIRVFDNRETEEYVLQQELKEHENLRFLIGDVRDKDRLRMAMQEVDVVFHAAALKHVPSCEYNPFEAVKTNVLGTQNVIECALKENVGELVNISTDKVTNTINTLGATKLLAERLVAAAEFYKGERRTKFCSVRFGNVLYSRGSVFELWQTQMSNGKPLTVTDHGMTRFFMSVSQAVRLVFRAAEMTHGGEVFVLKMPVIKLDDLAETVIHEWAPQQDRDPEEVEVETIGVRPGERLHEELMTEEEARNALETDALFIILPWNRDPDSCPDYPSARKATCGGYSSREVTPLTRSEIRELFEREGVF